MRVTADGEMLIKRWMSALRHVEQLTRQLFGAKAELDDAVSELAKWMLPDDARTGEKISVWFGDSLVQVECADAGSTHRITVRQRGRSLDEI